MTHDEIMEAILHKPGHRYNTSIPVNRRLIAKVIEEWVNGNGNIAALSQKHQVSHTSIAFWISKYYLPLRLNENTRIEVKQSKINNQ